MGAVIKINPNFNRIQNAVSFATRELNYILEEQVYDGFSFYQGLFGVYSFMRLTKDLKHRVHSMSASPMIWQPHKSCHIDPLGNVTMGVQEIDPCKGTALSEFCYDELFDSCFSHFFNWDGQGPLELDENGREMLNRMTAKILESMVLGARLTLTANGLYDTEKVEFKKDVSTDIRTLFTKTATTCQGWVAYLKKLSKKAGYSHLNVSNLLKAEHFNGKAYQGDIEVVYQGLIDNAPNELGCLIDEGGIESALDGISAMPIIKASTQLYKATAAAYRKQCETTLCLNPRLSMEKMTWNGQTKKVYFFDELPIVPIHDVSHYDKYLKHSTHFAALTLAGNVNLGASFRDLPSVGNQNAGVGVRIKMKDENENYGIYSFRSDSLFSTMIANTDFMVATCIQTTEEN